MTRARVKDITEVPFDKHVLMTMKKGPDGVHSFQELPLPIQREKIATGYLHLGHRQLQLLNFMTRHEDLEAPQPHYNLVGDLEVAQAATKLLPNETAQRQFANLLLKCACELKRGTLTSTNTTEILQIASYVFPPSIEHIVNTKNDNFHNQLSSILGKSYAGRRSGFINYYGPERQEQIQHMLTVEKTSNLLASAKDRADGLKALISAYGQEAIKLGLANYCPRIDPALESFFPKQQQVRVLAGVFKYLKELATKENNLEALIRNLALASATFPNNPHFLNNLEIEEEPCLEIFRRAESYRYDPKDKELYGEPLIFDITSQRHTKIYEPGEQTSRSRSLLN